jgi:8-oxo-dGTP pyrophosphatase MutT (NUDIX family)
MSYKNSKRALVRIIRELACEYGIDCQSFSYDFIFKLDKNGESRVIYGYGFPLRHKTMRKNLHRFIYLCHSLFVPAVYL